MRHVNLVSYGRCFARCFILIGAVWTFEGHAETVHYDLVVSRGDFKLNGKTYHNKVLVNGGIPAPKLVFRYGDTAEIRVVNDTDEKTLIHWHGLLLPNDQDGVPYVNSFPILPHSEKVYRFPLKQTGTYWYHSHVMFQEQDGLYGAFIILPEKERSIDSAETVVLSDFTQESGKAVQRNLKKDGEYYDVKKGTVQSWLEAFRSGNALAKWRDSLQRMEGMDYADVGYDFFLANGKSELRIQDEGTPGGQNQIKLRIINGSATSIYKLTYAGGPIQVTGADGLSVDPVKVNILPISVAETYDITLTRVKGKRLELRATSLDNSGYSSIFIGSGDKTVPAPAMPWQHPISFTMGQMMGMKQMPFFKELAMNYRNEFSDLPKEIDYRDSETYELPKPEMLKPMMAEMKERAMPAMGSSADHRAHESRGMKPEQSFRIMNLAPESMTGNRAEEVAGKPVYNELTYGLLKSEAPIDVQNGTKLRTIHFTLNGNMEYYIWSINGVPVGPETYIKIHKGERVRFIMKNTTMMNHPMHLHGHFFRVMTNQGKWSVLKHTVNVAPLDQAVIEFDASEEKDWFFHCHLLYHMMSGMTRIVRYENEPGSVALEEARKESEEFNLPSSYYFRSRNFVQSNYFRTETSAFSSYYHLMLDVLGNYDQDLEAEVHAAKILTRYLQPYLGAKTEGDRGKFKTSPTVGFTWILPLNIGIDFKYQPLLEQDFELEFQNEIQLTSRLQFNYEYSSKRKFYTELEYRQTKNFSFLASYNQTYHRWGAGLAYTY